jgi:hypothetical protein
MSQSPSTSTARPSAGSHRCVRPRALSTTEASNEARRPYDAHRVRERAGRLDYDHDATRWMRKPTTYTGDEAALEATAQFHRKSLWQDAEDYVEIWCEKDALAGVMWDVT